MNAAEAAAFEQRLTALNAQLTAEQQRNAAGNAFATGISHFSGTDGGDIEEFLLRFAEIADARNWDAGRRGRLVAQYLKGPALEVYRGLTDAQRGNWDQTAAALRDSFVGPDGHVPGAPFANCTQGFSTVIQYKYRLMSLVDKEFPLAAVAADGAPAPAGFNVASKNELLRRSFLAGLRSDLRFNVIAQQGIPATLDEAVARARRIEGLLKAGQSAIIEGAQDPVAQGFETMAVAGGEAAGPSQLGNRTRAADPARNTAPPPKRQELQGDQAARTVVRLNGDLVCPYCKVQGHTVIACFRFRGLINFCKKRGVTSAAALVSQLVFGQQPDPVGDRGRGRGRGRGGERGRGGRRGGWEGRRGPANVHAVEDQTAGESEEAEAELAEGEEDGSPEEGQAELAYEEGDYDEEPCF